MRARLGYDNYMIGLASHDFLGRNPFNNIFPHRRRLSTTTDSEFSLRDWATNAR